jgi:hypothetical protein
MKPRANAEAGQPDRDAAMAPAGDELGPEEIWQEPAPPSRCRSIGWFPTPWRREAGAAGCGRTGAALAAVAVAIALPLSPIGRWFGFVAPSPLFFVFLIGATAAYLALVEVMKKLFYGATVRR